MTFETVVCNLFALNLISREKAMELLVPEQQESDLVDMTGYYTNMLDLFEGKGSVYYSPTRVVDCPESASHWKHMWKLYNGYSVQFIAETFAFAASRRLLTIPNVPAL